MTTEEAHWGGTAQAARIATIREVVALCLPLTKRAPDFVKGHRSRLDSLAAARSRVAVAGAQGVGKSTLMRSLLSSPEMSSPPVPVSQREETRVPIVTRWAATPGYRELHVGGPKYREGEILEDEVRKRASADARFFDKARFVGLRALEIEHPRFPLPKHLDLVDLPGVSGALAGVSAWAKRHLLEQGTQCMIFVVGSAQSIDCVEDEANLIRAFGPLMPRTVFVQNIWGGFPDPVEETREANFEFLNEHLDGFQPSRYLKIDCDAALRAARDGAASLLEPLIAELAPFLGAETSELLDEEASRLDGKLRAVRSVVDLDLAAATGDHRRVAAKLAGLRAEIEALKRLERSLRAKVRSEKKRIGRDLDSAVDEHLELFTGALADFVKEDRVVTQKLLDRHVARSTGTLNRSIQGDVSAEIAASLDTLRKHVEKAVEAVATEASEIADELEIDTPEIELVGLRKMVRGVGKVVVAGARIGGGYGGAKAGAVAGSFFGPWGTVIGGVLGGIVGLLAAGALAHKGRQAADAAVAQSQLTALLKEFNKSLPSLKKSVKKDLRGVTATVLAGFEKQTTSLLRDRRATFEEKLASAHGAAGGSVEQLELELASLDEAIAMTEIFLHAANPNG